MRAVTLVVCSWDWTRLLHVEALDILECADDAEMLKISQARARAALIGGGVEHAHLAIVDGHYTAEQLGDELLGEFRREHERRSPVPVRWHSR